MAIDLNQPQFGTTVADDLDNIRDTLRFAIGGDEGDTLLNPQVGSRRYKDNQGRWEIWGGSSWTELPIRTLLSESSDVTFHCTGPASNIKITGGSASKISYEETGNLTLEATDGKVIIMSSGKDAIRVLPSGYVGINLGAFGDPTFPLSVAGAINCSGGFAVGGVEVLNQSGNQTNLGGFATTQTNISTNNVVRVQVLTSGQLNALGDFQVSGVQAINASIDPLFKLLVGGATKLTNTLLVEGISTFSADVSIGTTENLGILTLDGFLAFSSTQNGVINSNHSLRINIDANNSTTGESFTIGHNQTAIDNNNVLFTVQDDGKVGIGTNTPFYLTHLKTETNADKMFLLENSAIANTQRRIAYMGVADNAGLGRLDFGLIFNVSTTKDASPYMSINLNNGFTGVGTDTPISRLDVLSTLSNTVGDGGLTLSATGTKYANFRLDGGGNFNLDLYNAGSYNALHIDRLTGKVGIATVAPKGKLHVATGSVGSYQPDTNADDLIVESTGHTGITIISGTSSVGQLVFGDNGDPNIASILYSHSSNNLDIKVNAQTRMVYFSDGDVAIGSTSHIVSSRLNVHGTGYIQSWVGTGAPNQRHLALYQETDKFRWIGKTDSDVYAKDIMTHHMTSGNTNFGSSVSSTARLSTTRNDPTAYTPFNGSSASLSELSVINTNTTAESFASLTFVTGVANGGQSSIVSINKGSNNADLAFLVDGGVNGVEAMRILNSKNVRFSGNQFFNNVSGTIYGSGTGDDSINIGASNGTTSYLKVITTGATAGQVEIGNVQDPFLVFKSTRGGGIDFNFTTSGTLAEGLTLNRDGSRLSIHRLDYHEWSVSGTAKMRLDVTGFSVGTLSAAGQITAQVSINNMYAYIMKDSSGNNRGGLYVRTNGAGELALADQSSLQTIRLSTDGNSHIINGRFGLGTSSQQVALSITRTTTGSSDLANDYSTLNIVNESVSYTSNDIIGSIGFGKAQGYSNGLRAGIVCRYSNTGSQASNIGTSLHFKTAIEGSGSSNTYLTIGDNGFVGIGSGESNPSHVLTVGASLFDSPSPYTVGNETAVGRIGTNALYLKIGNVARTTTNRVVAIQSSSSDLYLNPTLGNVAIGNPSSTKGKLHISTSSTAAFTVSTQANELVLEANSSCGMTIVCSDGGAANIYLGKASNTAGGQISYTPNVNWLTLGNTGARLTLRMGTNDAVFDGCDIVPETDNVKNVGSATKRWGTIYAGTGTINTSDERQKRNITSSDLGLDFIKLLRPVSYKWKDITYQTNEGEDTPIYATKTHTRNHFGFIAQEVEEALKGKDFGGLIKTPDINKEGKEDFIYGLRYSELIAPMVKAIQELEARLEAMEDKHGKA